MWTVVCDGCREKKGDRDKMFETGVISEDVEKSQTRTLNIHNMQLLTYLKVYIEGVVIVKELPALEKNGIIL